MKNKDQIFLEDMYLKTRNIINEDSNDLVFECVVDLDVLQYKKGVYFDHPKEIRVKYRLEFEYKSWGISGASAIILGFEPFTITVTDEFIDSLSDEEREVSSVMDDSFAEHKREVEIVYSKDMRVEWGRITSDSYGQIRPNSVEFFFDDDFKVESINLVF